MPTKVIRSSIDAGAFSLTGERQWLEWVYKVAGDFDEVTCLTAVDDVTGLSIPAVDDPHASNPDLLVTELSPRRVDYSPAYGPVFEITVRWESAVGGGVDPLEAAAEYQWDFEEETETIDYDLQGRAFVNVNYDPIRGGYQLPQPLLVLKVWRREPVFDVTRAIQTQKRVNEEPIVVLGETIPKECMILWSYRQATPLRVGQSGPVRTELLFKFKEPKSEDDRPWQAILNNVGFNGFSTANEYGPFRPEKVKDFITEPIPLDSGGKPLYGTYKIGHGTNSPVTAEAAGLGDFVDLTFPKRVLSATTPAFVKLIFDVRRTYDFSGFVDGIM